MDPALTTTVERLEGSVRPGLATVGVGLETLGPGDPAQSAPRVESSSSGKNRPGFLLGLSLTEPRRPPRRHGGLENEANVSWFHGGWTWPVEGGEAFAPIHSPALRFQRMLDGQIGF